MIQINNGHSVEAIQFTGAISIMTHVTDVSRNYNMETPNTLKYEVSHNLRMSGGGLNAYTVVLNCFVEIYAPTLKLSDKIFLDYLNYGNRFNRDSIHILMAFSTEKFLTLLNLDDVYHINNGEHIKLHPANLKTLTKFMKEGKF